MRMFYLHVLSINNMRIKILHDVAIHMVCVGMVMFTSGLVRYYSVKSLNFILFLIPFVFIKLLFVLGFLNLFY